MRSCREVSDVRYRLAHLLNRRDEIAEEVGAIAEKPSVGSMMQGLSQERSPGRDPFRRHRGRETVPTKFWRACDKPVACNREVQICRPASGQAIPMGRNGAIRCAQHVAALNTPYENRQKHQSDSISPAPDPKSTGDCAASQANTA